MGTVPDNMTLCYGAIMNDFDLKHKIMNPRGNCHKVMHRPPFSPFFNAVRPSVIRPLSFIPNVVLCLVDNRSYSDIIQ